MQKIGLFIKKYEFPVHLIVGGTTVFRKIVTFVFTVFATWKLKALGCHIGTGFRVDGKLWIWTKKKRVVEIGDNVLINSRFGSNLVGLTNPVVFQCLENGKITIGDCCGLSSVILSSRTSITIGEHVNIGGNVRIFDHNYHSMNYLNRRDVEIDQQDVRSVPVHIGDDVFIGTNAIILKGVSIGDRAVVGAGSVVSKNIPADEVWAGNPARCVRKTAVREGN